MKKLDDTLGLGARSGAKAVMASDFATAQFYFLERLLVVHGHWCYKRIAQMELFQHHVQAREGYVGTPCWCLSLAESPSPVSFFARSFLET
ncbi:hypothetical protein DM860_010129 [Cuscuta australis]|uniref:P-type ATPase C-terminal domain-containing protein n=1 Tax=Cuscuta australis TaxID=267555 RepID=A0A328D6I2_9ASTE|nr:hypothetical protein DM860_010129 [Cuscuta australis]